MTQYYEIRIKGILKSEWSEWFDGMTIAHDAERRHTVLTGPVADQTALYSLLIRARDLSLTLVSVNPIERSDPKGF